MLKLNPQKLRKNGRDEYVILTAEEYSQLEQRLQDAEDVLALRAAKAKSPQSPSASLDEVKRRYATPRRKR